MSPAPRLLRPDLPPWRLVVLNWGVDRRAEGPSVRHDPRARPPLGGRGGQAGTGGTADLPSGFPAGGRLRCLVTAGGLEESWLGQSVVTGNLSDEVLMIPAPHLFQREVREAVGPKAEREGRAGSELPAGCHRGPGPACVSPRHRALVQGCV